MNHYVVKITEKCTNEEIKRFHNIVIRNKDIKVRGLKERIKRTKYLCFCMSGDEVAGVIALKRPDKSYISRVFTKAGIPEKTEEYPYEIGYLYVIEQYRRQGIARVLSDKILSYAKNKNIFAVINETNINAQKSLSAFNFEKQGQPYQSKERRFQLYLKNAL